MKLPPTLLLSLALLPLLLPGCSTAARNTGREIVRDVIGRGDAAEAVRLLGPATVATGDAFVVEVHVDVGQDDLAAYAFTLTWDSDAIEVTSLGSGRGRMGNPLAVNLQRGSVRFNGISVMRGVTGDVHVADLLCVARRRGSTQVEEHRSAGDTLAVYESSGGLGSEELSGWSIAPLRISVD